MPEDEMQELIAKAKSGNNKAQTELLKKFEGFLTKYVSILYHSRYDAGNYDSRKFIALFIKDTGVRQHLLRNKLNRQGYTHVNKCLSDIQFMVERYGDEEDVRQTVEMTFFQCIDKYSRKPSKAKPDEYVPFSGFLYSYFYYLLKKNVDAFLIDQLGLRTFPLIADESPTEDEGGEIQQGYTAPPEPSAEELLGTEDIDEYWVMGDTALAPFDNLTMQDRQLLKWRFVDGEKSSEIALRITEHPNTVREHFNKIRKQIKENINSDLES